MTPIKRGTARRLGLMRPSLVARLDRALKLQRMDMRCPATVSGIAVDGVVPYVEQCCLVRSHDGAHETVDAMRWSKVRVPSDRQAWRTLSATR